ncbi:hypothetical protein BWGOE13_55190 [Bacillus mycoides]|uniref:Metallo-beta-lactamase domain-containing protein n=1 Tax=Bacillus mycoides TaxID=1405 RepID=A0A1E8BLB2_BACMY|nr:MBL fold metallo-hydrolase [Bacillus mycoides]OFD90552.1 hypothetical protein BWGOE11_34160 [Bacillus mycoides]OFD91319.1 hypothetical protein BWGOE13_55190 [Bacillus mycoides]
MSKIQLNMFEAGNGDSFLIKCIDENITNILVDFGYSNTYKKHVEKHLRNMNMNNEKLDLVIVTHIDQDHISGGIRFFEDNGRMEDSRIISVGEVWHNSYKHLEMAETEKILTDKEREHITKNSIFVERNREGNTSDTSAIQGSRLAANLNSKGYRWNDSFGGQAVSYRGTAPIYLNEGIKITVLSPTITELEKLRKTWKRELKIKFPTIELSNDTIFDDAVECISLIRRPRNVQTLPKNTSTTVNPEHLASAIFQEDTDEINASSITCIVEFMNKRILLLGDSTPSVVEAQIKKIYKEVEFPIIFDAIKVSHHGSAKNTSKELLDIIDSEHYFISTNGNTYGHPDVETIAKIIVRDQGDITRNLYFTNKIEKLNIFDNLSWQQKYQYRMHYKSMSEDSLQIYL